MKKSNNIGVESLEKRVQTIELYFKVAFILAAIFGFGGAWGGTLLTEAKKKLGDLQKSIKPLEFLINGIDSLSTQTDSIVNNAITKMNDSTESILIHFSSGIQDTISKKLRENLKGGLGDWEARIFNNEYVAQKDGFVIGILRSMSPPKPTMTRIYGYSGTSTNSNPLRGFASVMITKDTVTVNPGGSFMMPVRKGESWKVDKDKNGGEPISKLFWIPLTKF